MLSKTERELIRGMLLNENADPHQLASMHLTNAFRNTSDANWHHANMASMANRLADHYRSSGNHKLADVYSNLATAHESSAE